MVFREIAFTSADYRAEWDLRERVLRQPLGLSLHNEDLAAEGDHLHFGLFDESGRLIGCVIAMPLGPGEARLRQMAVDPEFAGRGHGARILRDVETELRRLGYRHLLLHARKPVAGFYENSGYAVSGPEFEEIGIPHLPMTKDL
jgi:predicted GNAT family N-acyltransferase